MFEFLNDDKLFNNDEKVVELSNKEKLLLEANRVEISMESAEPKNLLDSVLRDATSEDRERVERTETIKIACEDIQSFIPQTIAMEREIAMPVSRQVKELFTLYPGIIWKIYKDTFTRITWMYLDFYRDILTLSHVRGFIKRVFNIDSSNEISNSKKERIERYLVGGGWWSFMENSLATSFMETMIKHQTWMKKTPSKPTVELTLITSDTMIGATYMKIDTTGMTPELQKESETILADMAQRMAGVVQRKGYEYNVDFQWGVVKNKLNPKVLEATVYAPIKLTD